MPLWSPDNKTGRLVMERRRLLKGAGATAVTGAVSAPAIAQSAPTIKWRLTTTFPKTLDTLYGACDLLAKTVGDLSDQKFQISIYGPGEIVPSFQVLDAVANNTVEIGNSADYYYIGKDPAFAFGTAVPFGLNTRQMNAWLAYGGGGGVPSPTCPNLCLTGAPLLTTHP